MVKEIVIHTHTYTHTHRNIILPEKEGNPDIWDNMDEPTGHYIKKNKLDTKRQILHDLTQMWNLRKLSLQKLTVVTRGREVGQMLVKAYEVAVM